MKKVKLSNNTEYSARLEVWDDLSTECKDPVYRLFWVNIENPDCGTPADGYCSNVGQYFTIKGAIADGLRRFGEKAVRP